MFSYFLRRALHSEKNSFGCYVYLFLARSTSVKSSLVFRVISYIFARNAYEKI